MQFAVKLCPLSQNLRSPVGVVKLLLIGSPESNFGFLVNFCYQINRAAIYGAFDVDRLIDGDFHCSDDSSFHMTCSDGPNLDKQSIGHLSLEFQNEPLGR